MTYAKAGVDIALAKKAIRALAGSVRFSRVGFGAPLPFEGHYAGLVDFGPDWALALCTDGVGTKVLVAEAVGKYDTIGIDCIAMNVNDCICVGAEPLAFVDYLVVERADPKVARAVGRGLDRGARLANVSLVGGETAQMPGVVKGLDLAGTCLGAVRKDRIVSGAGIRPGDVLVGVSSSGIHSNGLTLARAIFRDAGVGLRERFAGQALWKHLLEPTAIYVRPVLELLGAAPVHGLANITGGGVTKLPRLHSGVRFVIDEPMPVPPFFAKMQELGRVADDEMYRTFNMGMGFLAVLPESSVEAARKTLGREFDVAVVGRVDKGRGVAVPGLSVEY
ncbi:MAG: phosphoribosylformylglycinamidine cyclo-ligase [Methanobacteriota archaeon]